MSQRMSRSASVIVDRTRVFACSYQGSDALTPPENTSPNKYICTICKYLS